MEIQRFYMVWVPGSGKGPMKQHPNFTEAKEEALRLAKASPGVVYVLETVGQYMPQDPAWTGVEIHNAPTLTEGV